MARPLTKTYSKTQPYVVSRHDCDDGSISYEIVDERPETYRRLCSLNDAMDYDPDEPRPKHTSKSDAELIALALNRLHADEPTPEAQFPAPPAENGKNMKLERAELGVDGNAGFALLGEDLQSGEVEFVEIALPTEASKDPNRYHKSEWCRAAEIAASLALVALKLRLPDRKISYYLGESHPRHLG